MAEPQLNRGYVIGFIKRFTLAPEHKLALNTEITNLENSSMAATKRDFNIWYESEMIGQGFTNQGQVIGAGIGPGSSTQQVHRSEEHTSELQSRGHLVCRLLLAK